jgi:RNA-directed DNA polymerase
MKVLREKIRAATSRSRAELPVASIVADLNPVLRGWAA